MEALLKSIERESEDVAKALEAPDGQMVEVVYKANRVDEEVAKPATPNHIPGTALRVGKEHIVRVKNWMTQEGMDFNINWNNKKAMPFRVMAGRVLKETRGMVYMSLKARRLRTDYCMKCGRPLTHPVSRLYGLGPECGQHFHINPFETEQELREAVEEVDKKLSEITWSGWIARSGIEYAMEVNNGFRKD